MYVADLLLEYPSAQLARSGGENSNFSTVVHVIKDGSQR